INITEKDIKNVENLCAAVQAKEPFKGRVGPMTEAEEDQYRNFGELIRRLLAFKSFLLGIDKSMSRKSFIDYYNSNKQSATIIPTQLNKLAKNMGFSLPEYIRLSKNVTQLSSKVKAINVKVSGDLVDKLKNLCNISDKDHLYMCYYFHILNRIKSLCGLYLFDRPQTSR
ncbi:hypothetical protein, partial [Francisella sp. XLW-1]|uniref:hypothetical protein n=1 Tax=Francisella sp. XLW-1 TaxID=2610887 RepID=UPI00168CF8A0